MNALLILSHGSRRTASNDEVFQLTDRIRQSAGSAISLVECSFLELAEPSVPTLIDQLVEKGATQIKVFPHFLAAGTHVTHDIPMILKESREKHPDIHITCLPHLGVIEELPTLIFNLSQTH